MIKTQATGEKVLAWTLFMLTGQLRNFVPPLTSRSLKHEQLVFTDHFASDKEIARQRQRTPARITRT